MLKLNFIKWATALSLFSATLASAAQIQISFQTANDLIPTFFPSPAESSLSMANEAFKAKYGAEDGFLGTASGPQGELVVYVSHMYYAGVIWKKMLLVGDGTQGVGGIGFFNFDDGKTEPLSGYQFAGRIQVTEGTQGSLLVLNGTPAIRSFKVAMENKCIFSRAAVTTVNNTPVQPTKLIGSTKTGAYTITYEHLVNGGSGALLSSIVVTLGRRHPLGFITDICPVDIYVRY